MLWMQLFWWNTTYLLHTQQSMFLVQNKSIGASSTQQSLFIGIIILVIFFVSIFTDITLTLIVTINYVFFIR